MQPFIKRIHANTEFILLSKLFHLTVKCDLKAKVRAGRCQHMFLVGNQKKYTVYQQQHIVLITTVLFTKHFGCFCKHSLFTTVCSTLYLLSAILLEYSNSGHYTLFSAFNNSSMQCTAFYRCNNYHCATLHMPMMNRNDNDYWVSEIPVY